MFADDRWVCRRMTIPELICCAGLDLAAETINKHGEQFALKCIGNAIPSGLLQSTYEFANELYYMLPQLEINPSLPSFPESVTKCCKQIHKMFNIKDSNTEVGYENIELLDVGEITPHEFKINDDGEIVHSVQGNDIFTDIPNNVTHEPSEPDIKGFPDPNKKKHLVPIKQSEYPAMLKEGTPGYKLKQVASTTLIQTYGCGPSRFDFLVDADPFILGKFYGKKFTLEIGDWRYCEYDKFAYQYASKSLQANRSRSVSTTRYSTYEQFYDKGQAFSFDPKYFSKSSKRGNNFAFIITDLITGFTLAQYVKVVNLETTTAMVNYAFTTIQMRFNIKIKLLLCDSAAENISPRLRSFCATIGITLRNTPPYMAHRNKVEQTTGQLVKLVKFHLGFVNGVRINGRAVTPADVFDYALEHAITARNNTISTVFYRNTGETLSYLSAISSGKENTTPILRFFLQVFTKSRDAKAHESHNLNAFVLGNAHFNPLVETIPNIQGSAAGPDSHILLLTNGTTRTSGQIFLPINSTYGKLAISKEPLKNPITGEFAHKEMRPKVKRSTDTMPELVEASESEDESSDEENPSSANLGREKLSEIE